MKSARSIAAMVLTGVFALSGIQVSFGQLAPAPGSPGGIPQPSPVPQPVPPGTLPGLTVYRGSHIIGATAILYNGAPIGTVQDIVFVNGVGEYVLVSNARGFVTIPRRLTIFEPISRVLRVNMTVAQRRRVAAAAPACAAQSRVPRTRVSRSFTVRTDNQS